MKKAGCVLINYGIESMDDEVLKNMNKKLTTKQIIKGIKATIEADIDPGFNIIFGNIGDTRDSLNRGVEFILEYTTFAQKRTIRPVTPYPGSPLYYYAIKKGYLKDVADFYENKHLNSDAITVNFTDLSDDEFYQALYDANCKLLKQYYQHCLEIDKLGFKRLYFDKDYSYRGPRHLK
jgi:radical SAM superfamily enzyme YgiQ (UPF0313 family)